MRVFGKRYDGFSDVYIKIRVELLDFNNLGKHTVFIMSFHFAEHKLEKIIFHIDNKEV